MSAQSVLGRPAATGLNAAEDDLALMRRVVAKDSNALATLYDRYCRRAFALAFKIVRSREHAEDVVQEVFTSVWCDAIDYDPLKGNFPSYLFAMVHHKSVDAIRREERLQKRQDAHEMLDVRPEEALPEDEVWQKIRGEKVRAALSQVPTIQRHVLEMAYYNGRTQSEIAGITNTPLGTVKTRALAGVKKLSKLLENSGLEDSAVVDSAS